MLSKFAVSRFSAVAIELKVFLSRHVGPRGPLLG
jgi:hypothetical protein